MNGLEDLFSKSIFLPSWSPYGLDQLPVLSVGVEELVVPGEEGNPLFIVLVYPEYIHGLNHACKVYFTGMRIGSFGGTGGGGYFWFRSLFKRMVQGP